MTSNHQPKAVIYAAKSLSGPGAGQFISVGTAANVRVPRVLSLLRACSLNSDEYLIFLNVVSLRSESLARKRRRQLV